MLNDVRPFAVVVVVVAAAAAGGVDDGDGGDDETLPVCKDDGAGAVEVAEEADTMLTGAIASRPVSGGAGGESQCSRTNSGGGRVVVVAAAVVVVAGNWVVPSCDAGHRYHHCR